MPKIMKQIDEVLNRHLLDNKPPLRKKWQALTHDFGENRHHLIVMHYHHIILVVSLDDKKILYQWHEKPADKRGLDSALAWLTQHGYIKNLT